MSNKLKFANGDIELTGDMQADSNVLVDMIKNKGRVPNSDLKVSFADFCETAKRGLNDLVTVEQLRPLLNTTIQRVAMESAEPSMVITGMFERLDVPGLDTFVIYGGMGAAATASDVGEHASYPESSFQMGGGMQTAYVGKSGVQASITDEVMRKINFPVFQTMLQEMGKSLSRLKEKKARGYLYRLGTALFDNADPTNSLYGVCTGRGLDMAGNGTLDIDNIYTVLAHAATEGFPVDTILVSPMAFLQWGMDQNLRNMLGTFGGGRMFNKWAGNPGPLDPFSYGQLGGMAMSPGNSFVPANAANGAAATGISGKEFGMTSTFNLPDYFPWALSIVPTWSMPFDKEANTYDILFCSRGNIGYYLVDEMPTQTEWRNEDVESVKVKLRERYGFGVKWEGQGVYWIKNIKLGRNFWDGTIKASTMEVIAEIDPTVAVV